jgi:DNA-binding transcriptional ArsR family regulator
MLLDLDIHAMWLGQVDTANHTATRQVDCERCGVEVPDDPLFWDDDNPAWGGLCMACSHELDGTIRHLGASIMVQRILNELRTAPVSLNIRQLAQRTSLSRKTVSRWLHDLEYAGVVNRRRVHNSCYFRCTDQAEQATLFSNKIHALL